MRFAHCLSFSKKKGQLVYSIVLFAGFIFLLLCKSYAQLPVANALQLGGFRCIELKPYANDHYFEMYEMGEWIHSSFRQDVWKRLGVPYWYSENQGDIRVAKDADGLPDEVVIPLRNAKAKELCFLGHVGGGFDTSLDVETRIGEYELIYANGKKEIIPLIAGKNVADTAYGHFVDSAFFAYGQVDTNAVKNKNRPLTYHLGEALAIDPKIQLMTYSYKVAHPGVELKELRFRCTKSKTFIVLQALTLLQQGERLNPLVYQGKTLNPTPASAPAATPSWLEGSRSKERIVKLDGQWQFRIDPGNKGMRKEWFHDKTATHWRSIDVPGQWFVQGINYHGVAWYRRKLLVPKTFQGEKLLLRFERVDYDARVWVNGKYIGRHYGAYQSFNLDATDAILKGENNEIVVRVESPIDPGVQFYKTIAKGNAMDDIAQAYGEEGSMGGIYRSVFLIATGKAKIEDVWVRSEISQDLKKATARLAFSLTNAEPVSVKCVLKESGGSNRRSFTQTIESSNADSVLKEVTFDIPYPRLWYPWEQGKPELHELTIEAWSGNKLLAQHKSRVGIKQVEFKRAEHAVYVNGHRMFIKGMLFDDPHWQSLMDRRGYQYRLQLMKSANLNEVRLTTHASSPEFYELADEMGMLVWQETPLQWWYSHTEPIRQQILQVVSETIRQTRGHASVVGYSAWNEGGQEDFSDRVVALMQSLDSTKVISRASGHGDFDVHVYPTQVRNITRNTFFWSGFKFPFISETGAYGMPDIASLEEMFGKDLFKYNGAEYFWDPFTRWGFDDGPAYADLPLPMMWPVDKLKKTILDRAESSGRFYWQVMKSMYEVTRGQMFNPTTSCVYCRFDDAFPAAWLSLVNFVGRPLKAYYGVQQACQAVLPILWFDAEGAEDIRVINEYWKKSWTGCRLTYQLFDRDKNLIKQLTKKFDLHEDSVIRVFKREEIGSIWDNGNGFLVSLALINANGDTISKNSYDFTGAEIHDFLTSVYPSAPMKPFGATIITDKDLAPGTPANFVSMDGGYGKQLMKLDKGTNKLTFTVTIPESNNYIIRAAADSTLIRNCKIWIDGRPTRPETYIWEPKDPVSRNSFGEKEINWFAGWKRWIMKGVHKIELEFPAAEQGDVLLDALSFQPQ